GLGVRAPRSGAPPRWECRALPLPPHRPALGGGPPQELELRFEGVRRHVPTPAGAIILVPAGIRGRVRWNGGFEWLHVYLEPGLVARVAAEAFDLDPARLTVPPRDCLDLPHLRAAMGAVGAELSSGGAGGPLAAESLANVLAVHLIRHVLAPPQPTRRRHGTLPRAKLRSVVEYIEEHLGACPSLEQMAAVARLSPFHFARQFRAATGLPPHQYVIARRVERAKRLLQLGTDLSLADVARSEERRVGTGRKS